MRPGFHMQLTASTVAALVFTLLLAAPSGHADEAELSADAIAQRTLRADAFAWEGAKTRLKMVLVGADGRRQERAMEVTARRNGKLLQSLLRFSGPPELAGTAFLMREQEGGASEQYVYLSGLKRTRRIVGREREGSFMGSDFSYTDMQRIASNQVRNGRLPDEAIGKDACYVIESKVAAEAGSPYARIVTWVRKTDFVALRTRFFDKQDKLVKTLYARRVRELDGKQVVVEARMQSENGHATELLIESIERRDDLSDAMFAPDALERL